MSTDNIVPTEPSARIESIDVLRGFVVLGILTINILFFGLPYIAAGNPTLWGTYEGADIFAFVISQVVFEGAQRTIFSMLFGAGVILFIERLASDERNVRMGSLYYRRMIGLMLFGLIDMYLLLWFGDIIFLYGFVGLFLYLLKDMSARNLLICAGVLLVLSTLFFGALQATMTYLVEPGIDRAIEKLESGESLDTFDQEFLKVYDEYVELEEQIVPEVEAKRGGYLSAFPYVVKLINEYQWLALPVFSFWDVVLMMLIGMALYRLQVFDATRPIRIYLIMVALGFGGGVLINTYEVHTLLSNNYSIATQYLWTYNLGRLAMAFGYIGAIMLICKLALMARVRYCLAAVGRMALTNYLVQSVLCLIFFVLLGYFGKLRLHELYYVVFVIWILQLIYSPLWLARFRYGPAEYVWRRLTYGSQFSNRRSTRH